MPSDGIKPQIIEDLLALPSPERQVERLLAEQLLSLEGLSLLLDAAERLAGANPDHSYSLARLCEHASRAAHLDAIFPRAIYVQAQVHAIRGDFEAAQRLIETARSEYETLGMTLEALRTNVGLMRVLGETGHYAEAIQTGQKALAQIGAGSVSHGEATGYEAVAAMLLQNCGFCYEQTGRYDEALAAYAAAETRYQALGMADRQAHIVENRGAVLMALGRVQDALAAFVRAEQIYARNGLEFFQAGTLINIGEAHLLLANYVQSLQAFEKAAQLFDSLGETVDRDILLRHMGDAYLSLNLYAEALDAYSRARAGLQATGMTLHYAFALWGIGVAQMARGYLEEAGQALAEAVEILSSLDNRPLVSALLLEQSRLLESTTGSAAARELAQHSLAQVDESNWTVQKIYAYLRNADLALPDTAAAEPLLATAQQLVDTVELPQLRYRLQQRWGHLRLLQGDNAAAQRHLERAITEIEQLRSTLVQERLRASFLDDKTAAYQDLVQLHLAHGDTQSIRTAFDLTERAKSRALAELMAGVVQPQVDTSAGSESAYQMQRYQAELNALYNEILSSGDDTARRPEANTVKARAAELEQAISHLRLRGMIAQRDSTPPGMAARLPVSAFEFTGDVPLLVYHLLGDEIVAFIWHNGELHLLRSLSTLPQIQSLVQRLAAQWERFRTGQTFLSQHHRQLELSAQRLLQQLYEALMAPVVALLEKGDAAAGVRRLVIVPHGILHQLPFHAFYDGEQYLVERFAVSYAPSATVHALCRRRTRRRDGLALAVAAPDAQIPAAVAEAQQVAAHLSRHTDEVRLLLNEQATLAAVSDLAPQCNTLHLACHGLFRRDNPLFSALKLHDGWLTAANVTQLNLDGTLVTLSACESGRSQVAGGSEIIGLVYAFLSAGAATLLVSQWLVQDEVAVHFMGEWYPALTTAVDAAEALRRAQLAVREKYPHPFYWAPFILVGQRIAAS